MNFGKSFQIFFYEKILVKCHCLPLSASLTCLLSTRFLAPNPLYCHCQILSTRLITARVAKRAGVCHSVTGMLYSGKQTDATVIEL